MMLILFSQKLDATKFKIISKSKTILEKDKHNGNDIEYYFTEFESIQKIYNFIKIKN